METLLPPNTSLPMPLYLPPPLAGLKLSVVIPVRNEAASVTETLQSLACQTDIHGNALDLSSYEVLLLANNCTDETAEVARCFARRVPMFTLHVAEIALPREVAHVGMARRLLMDEACRRLIQCGQHRGVIATTDGDTRVAPDWVAQMLAETARGADAVGGRIRMERRSGQDNEARLYALRDMAYQRGLARLESLLDPDPADPWPRHHQFFGGSLGVTVQAYRRVGGLPPLRCLEDVALGDALRRADARIRHSSAVWVKTSARQEGRTALGLSSQLQEWGRMGRSGHAHWVQQPAAAAVRFTARRTLRRLRVSGAKPADLTALASALTVPATLLEDGIANTWQPFGTFWAEVMTYTQQPGGAWAQRWPLIEIAEALLEIRRRLASLR